MWCTAVCSADPRVLDDVVPYIGHLLPPYRYLTRYSYSRLCVRVYFRSLYFLAGLVFVPLFWNVRPTDAFFTSRVRLPVYRVLAAPLQHVYPSTYLLIFWVLCFWCFSYFVSPCVLVWVLSYFVLSLVLFESSTRFVSSPVLLYGVSHFSREPP